MKRFFSHLAAIVGQLPAGLLSAVAVVLLLWLTLSPQPLPETDIPLFPGADKLAHLLMFGGVAWGVAADITAHNAHCEVRRVAWAVAVGVFLLGGVIECMQQWMELGRSGDVADWISDGAGAFLGALAALATKK